MAKARCPDDATPLHYVTLPDSKIKKGKRGTCGKYGHRFVVETVDPLKLASD